MNTDSELAAPGPWRVEVSDQDLVDLKRRLRSTRWPAVLDGIGWEQGTDAHYLRRFVDAWLAFDWRAYETELNKLDHLRFDVDGQPIHVVHVRSPHDDALPLLLCHGWPGGFDEYLDVVDLLTRPEDSTAAFHLVIPSLPGFGFSGPTRQNGWQHQRIADAFTRIMDSLGYRSYALQGGDLGAWVCATMAAQHPERVVGLHLNLVPIARPDLESRAGLTQGDLDLLDRGAAWARRESAYRHLQETKPQTMGFALEDSPAGLASWLLDKFRAWSDCDGDLNRAFSMDRLVAHVATYWLTGTATSSMRIYYERAGVETPQSYVTVPTAVADYPAEVVRYPRAWAERHYNIVHWAIPPSGGHFAAMEVPAIFVDDVRTFFAKVREAD